MLVVSHAKWQSRNTEVWQGEGLMLPEYILSLMQIQKLSPKSHNAPNSPNARNADLADVGEFILREVCLECRILSRLRTSATILLQMHKMRVMQEMHDMQEMQIMPNRDGGFIAMSPLASWTPVEFKRVGDGSDVLGEVILGEMRLNAPPYLGQKPSATVMLLWHEMPMWSLRSINSNRESFCGAAGGFFCVGCF